MIQNKNKENNYAFIDSQNLNLSIQSLGWRLDFARFSVYLKEKYKVKKIFLFIGYVEGNNDLYKFLQSAGFICIFKPTLKYLKYKDGTTKGNVDAELVLQAMIDYGEYEKAVIVTCDGDFSCLVRHLKKEKKLRCVLIPNIDEYSALLKKSGARHLDFMHNLRKKLEYKKRAQ